MDRFDPNRLKHQRDNISVSEGAKHPPIEGSIASDFVPEDDGDEPKSNDVVSEIEEGEAPRLFVDDAPEDQADAASSEAVAGPSPLSFRDFINSGIGEDTDKKGGVDGEATTIPLSMWYQKFLSLK